MDPESWWHGWWWFLWLLPVFIVMVFAAVLVRGGQRSRAHRARQDANSARQIIDRRYAAGEISRQQYEEMKAALQR